MWIVWICNKLILLWIVISSNNDEVSDSLEVLILRTDIHMKYWLLKLMALNMAFGWHNKLRIEVRCATLQYAESTIVMSFISNHIVITSMQISSGNESNAKNISNFDLLDCDCIFSCRCGGHNFNYNTKIQYVLRQTVLNRNHYLMSHLTRKISRQYFENFNFCSATSSHQPAHFQLRISARIALFLPTHHASWYALIKVRSVVALVRSPQKDLCVFWYAALL
jgi:hypothetical protein